ncbi:MAG: sigma-70 family RNA polymerase sigma factor [Rhodocyclales bacterium]|nr:sigma-70 family RNA polymerase sigma factor [Rhodocyclales bacterium]
MADDNFDSELNRLRPTLLRFAVLQLRDEQAAEDAVQDTLLAAFEGRARFAGRAQLKTWVVAILKNKIVDRIRQRSREAPLPEVGEYACESEEFDALFAADGHWQEPPADWGDPAKALEQGRFYEVLELCMKALPENLARVFLMREILEMETDEICKELAISSSNCWVVLYRARMRLRECLQLRWFGEGAEAE